MPEKENNYLDILTKFGYKCEVKDFDGKQLLIIGALPEGSESVLQLLIKYKRHGGDCFDSTESEIKKGAAQGCYINMSLPRHVFPTLVKGEDFIGYDDPLGGYDLVIFSGKQDVVGKAADDFFSINHPYGKGFVFQKTVDG